MTDRAEHSGHPAPRGLRPEEVSLLIEELSAVMDGARLEKVFDHGPFGIVLRITTRALGRVTLLLSTRPGFSRFHVLVDPPTTPAKPTEPVMILREYLRGGVIVGIDQPGGDRLVRLRIRVRRDDVVRERSLVLELFGRGGRLIAFESECRTVRWTAGRGGIELGHSYRFPSAPPKKEQAGLPFQPELLIDPECRGEPLAFNHALSLRMVEAERRADYDEELQGLTRRVRVESKRRRTLLGKLEKDRADAVRWEEMQQHGELLKGALHLMKRGDSSVTVIDYYDAAQPEISLSLDTKSTPSENVKRYFKRARKRKRSIPFVEARRAECEGDLELLRRVEAQLESATDLDSLAAAAERLAKLQIKERSNRTGKSREKVERRRCYRTREGLEILVGRNAKENDRLSITVARGNDLFFHRADRPGPHVILRVMKGRSASLESIEDAAFIAAYFGGWRGPGKARVHYTAAKYVRKAKGLPPGKVLISREREYLVEYRPELLERIVVDG